MGVLILLTHAYSFVILLELSESLLEIEYRTSCKLKRNDARLLILRNRRQYSELYSLTIIKIILVRIPKPNGIATKSPLLNFSRQTNIVAISKFRA